MSLLSPAFLWAFLALLPLAAVYFLKVRPRRKSTSAYFLWEKIFSEKRATSLFHRLRDLLSLLLMLLAFSALVLALARPEFGNDDRKDLLILIDHSASMNARDGGRTRLESARKTARDIAIALDGNQRAAVAAVSRSIEFRSHLTVSPRSLIDAIDGIGPSDYPFSTLPVEALGNDAHWSGNFRILLLSDGAFTGAASLPGNIELIKVGAPLENLGIVGADLQQLPDGRMGFFFQIASSFPETRKADLSLRFEETGQIYKLIPIEAASGVNPPEIFYLDDAPPGKWVAALDSGDGFADDDTAWLAVPPKRPVRVRVNAANRFFFENSVLAFQRGGGMLRLVDENPEIAIEQGAPAGDEPLCVIFTPDGASPWWKSIGDEEDSVAPRVLIENHPVLRHIDLSGMAFIGARRIVPPDGAVVILESEQGNPLIYTATSGGGKALVVNLDPAASDLYFSAWFPVLVHGAATHLAGREDSPAPVYRPGDRVPVPGFRDTAGTTVLVPGRETPDEVTASPFGPLTDLGFFTFRNGSGEWPVGSSLLSAPESLLDNRAVKGTARPLSTGRAPDYWLLVVALLILVAESVLYHRRKVG